jgi:site-specific DNA-methyltransferase (adenine-specific)
MNALPNNDVPNTVVRNSIVVGDVRTTLPTIPEGSVDTVITSPPYFALRNYGVDNQIGLETSVEDWVHDLRAVLREVARVLKFSGSLWLNLGDTYSHHARDGALAKSLLLGPERLALAMIEDGWTIRSKVIWAKTNPMPTSVRDRLSCTYEVVYFATRSPRYFFDLDAIRIPHRSQLKQASASAAQRAATATKPEWAGPLAGSNVGLDRTKADGRVGHPLGKNPGDVWHLSTSNHRGEHHAMFPEALITPPLLATCPERVCARCGIPWERERARRLGHLAVLGELHAQCACDAETRPGLVLDPFIGAGTVGVVAEANGRDWLGIEIKPEFAQLAHARIKAERAKRDLAGHETSKETPMAA